MKKLILITGASSGFGKLTVPLLLQKGHTVIAGLRGGDSRLQEIFAKELEQFPNQLKALDVHMEKTASFAAIAQLIEKDHGGKLDVLINNAGYGLMGVLEEQSEQQLRHQMEVNFFGTAFLTQSLLPVLRNAKGRVLSVSSICGLSSFPFYGAYSASKFALEGLMQGLAYDMKPFGVQVGMIEPGGFRTDFISTRDFGSSFKNPNSIYHARSQAFMKTVTKGSKRQGDPIRVANLISKLCDDKKIHFRNVIGTDAKTATTLQRLLPNFIYQNAVMAVFEAGFKRGGLKK